MPETWANLVLKQSWEMLSGTASQVVVILIDLGQTEIWWDGKSVQWGQSRLENWMGRRWSLGCYTAVMSAMPMKDNLTLRGLPGKFLEYFLSTKFLGPGIAKVQTPEKIIQK